MEQKYKKPVDVGQYTSKDIKSLSQPDILCNIIEQSCDSATQVRTLSWLPDIFVLNSLIWN